MNEAGVPTARGKLSHTGAARRPSMAELPQS